MSSSCCGAPSPIHIQGRVLRSEQHAGGRMVLARRCLHLSCSLGSSAHPRCRLAQIVWNRLQSGSLSGRRLRFPFVGEVASFQRCDLASFQRIVPGVSGSFGSPKALHPTVFESFGQLRLVQQPLFRRTLAFRRLFQLRVQANEP